MEKGARVVRIAETMRFKPLDPVLHALDAPPSGS